MKKWMRLFFFIFITSSFIFSHLSYAQPKNISVKLDFNLVKPDEDGVVDEFNLKHTWTMAVGNHHWSSMQDNDADNRYVILSRIENANEKDVTIKFIVLDTYQNAAMVSTPTISVRYGQKGKMVITENNQKLALSVIATAA